MAISIVNQWTGHAGDQDMEVVANPTPGRMLVALVVARVVDGSAPTLAVGDVSRNGWTLVADPIQFASAQNVSAQLQAEVWACPSVRYEGWPFELVYVSATQITVYDVGSVLVNVTEVSGMTGQLTVDSVTLGTASAATSLALAVPAPAGSANCLMLGLATNDLAVAATPSGTGWTALTSTTTTAPNISLAAAWRENTTGGTVTFTGSSSNWAGVAVALRTTGTTPAQPNPAWPATSLQIGLGYDLSTPLSRVRWTDQTSRYLSLDSERGIQAERGTAQQGNTTLVLRDDDGAYTPRTVALAASATASGTTTTIKVADASATNIHATDFFRLKTAAGVLKQLDVFQVVSLVSAAGTTTITFKRADGSGAALASTASGDIYAGIQIDLYIPWRLQKTVAGTTYTVGSGWLRDLPVSFDDAHWAEVNAAGADALEVLSSAGAPSALQGEIYRRTGPHGLYAYWPMDDSSGSGYAANASGVSSAVLTQTASKYGAGGATADFGAATQDVGTGNLTDKTSLLGDPGSGWAQDGQTSAEMATKGYALVGSDPGMPPISGGVTIMGAAQLTAAQLTAVQTATADPTVCILRNTDPASGIGQGSIIKISMQRGASVGFGIVTRWDKNTHATTSTTCNSSSGFGGEWLTWALVFDQTSWILYTAGSVAGSGSCNLVASWSGIDVGGEADAFFHGRTFPGTHAHVAVYGRKLTAGEISRLSDSALFGTFGIFSTETASVRIQKKLAYAAWKNTRVLNPGVAIFGPEAAPSGSVADLGSDLALQEDSLVYADAANQLQYRNRIAVYQQFPRAILGDDTGSGEIPYQPGQLFDFNPTFLYNDVEVDNTHRGGYTTLTSSVFVAVDDTSAARYGSRTLPLPTRYSNDASAWSIAWWYLGRYAYPQMRVGSVTVSAVASNDTASSAGRWAFVCGVEVGDIVVVNRRPIGQPMISVRCRVLSVQPAFKRPDGGVTGQVTLTLGAAPPLVPIAGDTTYGVIGGTVLGA